MNVNRTILAGRITRDIETRTAQSGTVFAKFGLAVNRKRGNEEETCFIDAVAFGRTAEVIAQYLAKGDPIFVEGRLSYSTWEGQDGGKRSKLEVIVENFQFVGGKDTGEASAQQSAPRKRAESTESTEYDDIPF